MHCIFIKGKVCKVQISHETSAILYASIIHSNNIDILLMSTRNLKNRLNWGVKAILSIWKNILTSYSDINAQLREKYLLIM
jgi:hypothetical protein